MERLLSIAAVLSLITGICATTTERNITDLGPGLSSSITAVVLSTVRMSVQFPVPLPPGFAAVHRGGLDGPYYAGVFISNDTYLGSPLAHLAFLTDATYEEGNMTFLIRNVREWDEGTYYCVFEPDDYAMIYMFSQCGQRLEVLSLLESAHQMLNGTISSNTTLPSDQTISPS